MATVIVRKRDFEVLAVVEDSVRVQKADGFVYTAAGNVDVRGACACVHRNVAEASPQWVGGYYNGRQFLPRP